MTSNSRDSPSTGDGLPENITLRIVILAHGNRAEDDLYLVVSLDTTISHLKQRIQDSFSQHPTPDNQRLIYHGRPLLDANLALRQVLRVDQRTGSASHVMHLVVREPTTHSAPSAVPPSPQTQPVPRFPPMPQNAHMAIHNQLHNMQHQLHHAQALRASQIRLQPQPQSQPQQPTQPNAPQATNPARAPSLPQPNPPNPAVSGPNTSTPPPFQPATTQTTRIEERIGPHGERIRTVTGSNGTASSTTMTFRISGLNAPDPIDRPSSAPGSSPPGYADPANRAGSAVPQNIHVHAPPPSQGPIGFPFPPGMQLPPPLPSMFLPTMQPPPVPTPSTPQTMAWLLNSPRGPQGIVFAPGHGFFTTLPSQSQEQPISLRPTPTVSATSERDSAVPTAPIPQAALVVPSRRGQGTTDPPPPQPGAVPQQPRPVPVIAPPQQRRRRLEDNELVQLVLARAWLFMRLYIFIFVLSESGTWRRLILLTTAIVYCLLPRNNPLTRTFEIARRHFDNLIGPPNLPQHQPEQTPVPNARPADAAAPTTRQPQTSTAPQSVPSSRGSATTMPTPEEAARRLLDQQNRRNPNPVIDMLYRVEQGVVLFLASLIPGLGERHVQAREQARRILDDEERRSREERESQGQQLQSGGPSTRNTQDTQDDTKPQEGPLPASWSSAGTETGTGQAQASSSGVSRHAGNEGEVRARALGS